MSSIDSLGLDSTLIISCREQSIVTGIGGTLESYCIDSPVLHQEASLQKICALEKTQAAKKLIMSSCIPTTSALLLYHYYTTAVWPVRTANNAAIRAYTLLLYHHCCMYTYRQCITHTQNSRRHGLYVLPILQPWG